jgi:hypothetical protein
MPGSNLRDNNGAFRVIPSFAHEVANQNTPLTFRFARRAWYSASASGRPTNVRRRQLRHRTGYCSSASRSKSLNRKRDSRKLDEPQSTHVTTQLLWHGNACWLPTKSTRSSGI